MTSVTVPAHQEVAVVGRLLEGLLRDADPGELEVVVVANGCSDATADVARRHDGVTVLETPIPSKTAALRLADTVASSFPRLYVDADVEIDVHSVRLLAAAVEAGHLAAAPRRHLELRGRPLVVRAYYRVWEALPAVQTGLFGRGVVALSEQGHRRVAQLPQVTADDLWLHHAFRADERCIVEGALVVVHAPRRTVDLLRRRVRVVSGAQEVDRHPRRGPGSSRTRASELLALVRAEPRLAPSLVVFLAVTVLARAWAGWAGIRGGPAVWHRDESSRS